MRGDSPKRLPGGGGGPPSGSGKATTRSSARRRSRAGLALVPATQLPAVLSRPLPAQPTPLIGREHEVAVAEEMLLRDDVRLLTLTGPAGVGKTRLALALAERVQDRFEDGAVFVDLSPLRDPRLVPATIARALGLQTAAGRPVVEALADFMRHQQLLLVLDNFEHLLAAGPRLADLLASCRMLTMLVTSRAALHLRWEHVSPVPALALPELGRLPRSLRWPRRRRWPCSLGAPGRRTLASH